MGKLDVFLAKAIPAHAAMNSAHLGDRTMYVGASDIANCPRKAVLSKTVPVEKSVKQLLTVSRGHAAQAMFREIFKAGGATFEEEVELVHPEDVRIKCHVDFVFVARDRQTGKIIRVHLVEMKCRDGIRDQPFPNWVDQLHVQMGLARLQYGKEVEIGGSILAVDLNKGEYREYNGYRPEMELFEILLEKGRRIFECLETGTEPATETGPLCGEYCAYRSDCPAFAGAAELPDALHADAFLFEKLSRLKKQIEAKLDNIKSTFADVTGKTSLKMKVGEVLSVVTTVVGDSETVDAEALKRDFPAVYAKVKKERKGYMKVEVKKIPPPPAKKEKAPRRKPAAEKQEAA